MRKKCKMPLEKFYARTLIVHSINSYSAKTFYVRISTNSRGSTLLRLQLHGAIYRPDSFVLTLRYCENFKAIRYESTSLNRIVADKSHRVIVA